MSYFDVAIIGGGLVGASLARSLSNSNLKIVVIDQKTGKDLYNPEQENRGLALSYSSICMLHKLGLWPQLSQFAYQIKKVHVSEYQSFAHTILSAEKFSLPTLGYVLNASSLGSALIQDLEYLPNVTVIRPILTKDFVFDVSSSRWRIELEGQTLNAKILVLADGGNSNIAENLGINRIKVNTMQSAIVANLSVDLDHNDIAYERFTPEGVLAALPFGKRRLKFVWTLSNSEAEALLGIQEQDLIAKIHKLFGYRLGKILSITDIKLFPIFSCRAMQINTENLVLIGNAANTLHPVAAQGFNLGLRDAFSLAEVLRANKPLSEYARQRQKDHSTTCQYTNSLLSIFNSDKAWLKFGRALGLLAAQFVPSINKHITVRGSGVWIS